MIRIRDLMLGKRDDKTDSVSCWIFKLADLPGCLLRWRTSKTDDIYIIYFPPFHPRWNNPIINLADLCSCLERTLPESGHQVYRGSVYVMFARWEHNIKRYPPTVFVVFPENIQIVRHVVNCPSSVSFFQFGRTEVIDNTLNPDFVRKFVLDFFFEEKQNLRFDV